MERECDGQWVKSLANERMRWEMAGWRWFELRDPWYGEVIGRVMAISNAGDGEGRWRWPQ